jgi:hypothetical protein
MRKRAPPPATLLKAAAADVSGNIAEYKARILEEYDRLEKAGKGALMRREGLYSSLLSSWRTARGPPPGARSRPGTGCPC